MMNLPIRKNILPFLVFFIVANPATFKLVRSVAGGWVASAEGLPTTLGLLLHALVFVLLIALLQRLMAGKKSKYGMSGYGMEGMEMYEEEMYEHEEKSE
jgi:uncharacterized membrane protein YhiD involved in acid resistance